MRIPDEPSKMPYFYLPPLAPHYQCFPSEHMRSSFPPLYKFHHSAACVSAKAQDMGPHSSRKH